MSKRSLALTMLEVLTNAPRPYVRRLLQWDEPLGLVLELEDWDPETDRRLANRQLVPRIELVAAYDPDEPIASVLRMMDEGMSRAHREGPPS